MSAPAKCFLVVLLWLPLQACGLSGGPVEGIVLEETTNAPLPGAIVVARWKGSLFAFIENQTVCVHVESTTTDEQGRYRLPAWLKKSEIGWVRDLWPDITVYKPGYGLVREVGSVFYLQPFTGEHGERLEYLSRMAVSCSDKKEIEIKLLPLYRALYEEANSIAATREERIKALHHLKDIEKLEMGSTQAWENFHRREQELK